MSEVAGPAATTQVPRSERPVRRADGVILIGEMAGSGYRQPPALVRRADGQTVQLTPLLYATLSAIDGRRGLDELAAAISATTGRAVSEDNVRALVDKLRPLGLVDTGDGAEPSVQRSNPLLALRLKVAVSDPERTRRLTAPFARLFHPLVALPLLAAFAWICWWVLFSKGLASATHDAFAHPGLLLSVLLVTVFSAGFHEFGHAAATRRGGATPGVMGAGFYLIWPAFYTDVTDSYRLGRGGRLRTDLGGLYFNAIVTVATAGVWLVTQYDAVLLVVATQILQMLRQLMPLVRFDGYHVLADLTGVPDLFQRIGPTLRSVVPGLKPDPAAGALKPWARLVITAWVLTVVPVLAVVLGMLVLTLPRVVGTALASAEGQREAMLAAADSGGVLEIAARAVAMIVVLLPVFATAYMLARLARRTTVGVLRRTRGRPLRRLGAAIVALAVLGGLLFVWWPSPGRYRPVQAYEGGTLTDALRLGRPPTGFTVGTEGQGAIVLPADTRLPTRSDPMLAAVLVPSGGSHGDATSPHDGHPGTTLAGTPAAGSSLQPSDVGQSTPDTWVFPFDEPLAPDSDDNQALAVNTTDNTTTYDVAFALVWADGDDPVQTENSAYALASCSNCAAVAISFQVVLVIGEAAAVAPENVAVSVNYQCTSCLTFSLAVQLFATLDGPLSDAAMAELETLWGQVLAFGQHIGDVPLDQIQDVLSGFEDDILAIIEEDQGPLTEPSATPSVSSSASTDQSTTQPTSTSGTSGTAVPSESASPTGSGASSSTEPSETPQGSSGPSSSSSASASSSESPAQPSSSASASASSEPSESVSSSSGGG